MKKRLKKLSREELIEMLLDESIERPGDRLLQQELLKEKYRKRFRSVLLSTAGVLTVAAAAAVLAATLLLPVLRIYGSSMSPTLNDGEIVVSVREKNYVAGDIIAFYYGNKLLVKRYIAGPGDFVRIDEEGNVFVNDRQLIEPYIEEKAPGQSDISYPYQVPEGKYFVLGDHRSVSIDSRVKAIGCISDEQMVGRIIFRLWPLSEFGKVG